MCTVCMRFDRKERNGVSKKLKKVVFSKYSVKHLNIHVSQYFDDAIALAPLM